MDADVQSWNQTAIGSMEAHRLTATQEISGYRQCWENDGSHVLGQRRHDTHCVPKSKTVTGETYEDVLRKKFLPALREKGPKRLQLCSFNTITLLLIGRLAFTSFSTTSLKLFLMLRTHLTSHQAIFGCFQHWRTFIVVASFQVVHLLQQRFSSGHNEPLKKRFLRSCNRGVSVVKNVYGYRVITFRNDCIFSFIGWLIFQK